MQTEIIAIGNEVLAGYTINSNATFIAAELRSYGYKVHSHRVISDGPEHIKAALTQSLQTHDLVICTGGLGPTLDDLTRAIIAELFGCKLVYNEEVAQRLIQRFGADFPSLADQATIPEKAIPLHNAIGTAPGLCLEQGKKSAIFLPGVPNEMQDLMRNEALPYIRKRFKPNDTRAKAYIHSCRMREADIDPTLRELQTEYPQLEFGIYPSHGTVSVHLSAPQEADLAEPLKRLHALMGRRAFPAKSGRIQEAIHQYFINHKLTLSLAESCTGGAIAASLTQEAGASQYFHGGVVAYSNQIKEQLLGVKPGTLQNYGAVSGETVQEMAEGTLKKFHSDYAVAVSGIAGPSGGTAEKPVGTVWIAIARKSRPTETQLLQLRGPRNTVIQRAVIQALSLLWLSLPL